MVYGRDISILRDAQNKSDDQVVPVVHIVTDIQIIVPNVQIESGDQIVPNVHFESDDRIESDDQNEPENQSEADVQMEPEGLMQKTVDELSRLRKCQWCNFSTLNPRLLPCFHTVCYDCLLQHLELKQQINKENEIHTSIKKLECRKCKEDFIIHFAMHNLMRNKFCERLIEMLNFIKLGRQEALSCNVCLDVVPLGCLGEPKNSGEEKYPANAGGPMQSEAQVESNIPMELEEWLAMDGRTPPLTPPTPSGNSSGSLDEEQMDVVVSGTTDDPKTFEEAMETDVPRKLFEESSKPDNPRAVSESRKLDDPKNFEESMETGDPMTLKKSRVPDILGELKELLTGLSPIEIDDLLKRDIPKLRERMHIEKNGIHVGELDILEDLNDYADQIDDELSSVSDGSLRERIELPCLKEDPSDSSPAALFCVQCKQVMCRGCATKHTTMTVSRLHRMCRVGKQFDLREFMRATVDNCDLHETRAIQIFCQTCHMVGCLSCLRIHTNHHCRTISGAETDLRLEQTRMLKVLTGMLMNWCVGFENTLASPRVEEFIETCKRAVKRKFSETDEDVKSYRPNMFSSSINEINKFRRDISSTKDIMTRMEVYLNTISRFGSSVDIARFDNFFSNGLKRMQVKLKNLENDIKIIQTELQPQKPRAEPLETLPEPNKPLQNKRTILTIRRRKQHVETRHGRLKGTGKY